MRNVTGLLPKPTLVGATLALSALTFCLPTGASAADIKIAASAIGRPPIFSNTFADVGEAMGYWKKVGLDMSFRWFQRGTDTAKSVITGDVQVGYTATPVAINLIGAGAPIVIIAGMPNQDWIIGSDTVKDCKGFKGQTVAADGINNARWLFLKSVAESCGLKLTDMTPIDLANAPLVKAGIAGQVHTAVFHVDELAQIEFKTGKKWHLIPVPASIKAGLHYGSVLASKKAIAENKEGVIRFLEGWIMTQKLMSSSKPADIDEFAKIAAKAGSFDVGVAKGAIESFHAINYWVNNDGLDEKQMMGQADEMVKDGLLKPEAKPTYDKLVDKSLYAEAMKRVEKMGGMSK